MDTFDPLAADRELRKCAARWQRFRRALREGELPADDPFRASRWLCGRTTFDQLSALEGDPIARQLSRWVYRMTEQRVNREVLLTITERLRHAQHAVREPEAIQLSVAQMLKRALENRDTRQAWLSLALSNSDATHDAIVVLWERRQELAARFGLGSPDDVQAPCDDLYGLAERWLETTQDLWHSFGSLKPAELLETAMATGASLDFPTHLSPRSMLGFFRDTRLLEALELNPGPLPQPLAPASWLRAFARLGAGFADASAPRDQPFCIAHDAYGLERRCHGTLFAFLLMNGEFLKRRLGASRTSAPGARRALGKSLLIHSRHSALKVLLRRAALRGGNEWRGQFEELLYRTSGISVRARAAGVFLRLHDDDPQRFAGLLLGLEREKQLRYAHDEDWFRNPRAADQLRSESALPPRWRVDRNELESGIQTLNAWLLEALA